MSEWISVDDVWPGNTEQCIVYGIDNGEPFIAVCWSPDGDDDWLLVSPFAYHINFEFPDYNLQGVTHWMPLPEPPK